LYAFSSAANNNGSAFAGLSANMPFYNTLLGVAMFFGRFWLMIPVLAIAGSLAAKKQVPAGPGTLPTHTPLFVVFLVGVIVLVGALTFLPPWPWDLLQSTCSPSSSENGLEDSALSRKTRSRALFESPIVRRALLDSLAKLDPRHQIRIRSCSWWRWEAS